MKRYLLCVLIFGLSIFVISARATAQNGNINFVAQGTPSSGLAEPVRGFPICLLVKSFTDIRKEAAVAYPMPDIDAFVDKLDVSPELKTWMKKNKTVVLSGEDFTKLVKPDDVIAVPEFYKAYMNHNSDDQTLSGFPKMKYRASEAKKDPEKYAKAEEAFHEAIKKYVAANPQTLDGMDAEMTAIDPGTKWKEQVAKRIPEIDRKALELARSKYFVGQVQTDLQGRGEFHGLASGTYWLSSLGVRATVGDSWLAWDTPVQVRNGATSSVALTNSNSLSAAAPAP